MKKKLTFPAKANENWMKIRYTVLERLHNIEHTAIYQHFISIVV
jgi:hypothetical protein